MIVLNIRIHIAALDGKTADVSVDSHFEGDAPLEKELLRSLADSAGRPNNVVQESLRRLCDEAKGGRE